MNSNSIIVQEYLSSLKEDTELDHLFPILLNIMGFRIVQTARESKGQSQYGKDIIAIGKDNKGAKHKWYFELKGFRDKDITDKNYSIPDGIRESIIEAKDTAFKDSTIPEFNTLPIKIVLVHNGILKANIRPTFEGFISREFKEGEFERWDIYYLTDLFAKFLFNENLLSDDQSNRLFKKTLAFLDTPDYDYTDLKQLVQIQFEKVSFVKGRALTKLFATLGLLNTLIYHYSRENNFLIPAKECSKFIIIYSWRWIIEKKLDSRLPVIKEFKKLLRIQFEILNSYLKKTYQIAKLQNGLYSEKGTFFEKIGYPIRCYEYIEDLIYYCRLRSSHSNESSKIRLHNKQKDLIIVLIQNNDGFHRPIMDNHSISITQIFIFFLQKSSLRQKDIQFIYSFIYSIADHIKIEKIRFGRLPELHNNFNLIVQAVVTNQKPPEYCDSSSVLLAILLEFSVVFDSNQLFNKIVSIVDDQLSLQIPSIDFKSFEVEPLLFEKNLHNEYHVDCIERISGGLRLRDNANFEIFKKSVYAKIEPIQNYRTDENGFLFVRYLAHSYYKNEILPEEWRQFIEAPNPAEAV